MAAPATEQKPAAPQHYKGFVAGVFSGIAKLAGTHSLTPSHSHTHPLPD